MFLTLEIFLYHKTKTNFSYYLEKCICLMSAYSSVFTLSVCRKPILHVIITKRLRSNNLFLLYNEFCLFQTPFHCVDRDSLKLTMQFQLALNCPPPFKAILVGLIIGSAVTFFHLALWYMVTIIAFGRQRQQNQ